MTIAVVMGVSGCGKSTIASGIARELGWTLLEGDAFHPHANIAKMEAGIPLTDGDRWPWLRAIAAKAAELERAGGSVVIACSALKRAYRDILRGERRDTLLICLRGPPELIRARMAARHGHFMPPTLLDSQLATLEEPGPEEDPITVDISQPIEVSLPLAVSAIRARLGRG